MKSRSLIALASIALATACHPPDTERRAEWPRAVEPRLIGMGWQPCEALPLQAGQVVGQVRCGTPAPAVPQPCEVLKTAEAAARALAQPQCTDKAIETLQLLAPNDGDAAVTLAAAYYVRAQQKDDPSDFLRALTAADEALNVRPGSPELRFNIALTYEAMGLVSEARQSWKAYLAIDAASPWATEARRQEARLTADAEEPDAVRRDRAVAPLRAALLAKDASAIDRAIDAFPQAAQRFFDEVLLAEWAQEPSPEKLDRARMLAQALERRSGDRYPLALIDAIERAANSPETLNALARGHAAYAEGRKDKRNWPKFAEATRELTRGQSPLALLAQIRDPTVENLSPLLQEATRRHYLFPLQIAQSAVGQSLLSSSRYLEALRAYDDAAITVAQLRDSESMNATHTRRAGVLRMLGNQEAAWRESFQAVRDLPRVTSANDRHLALGEAAEIALGLGHPRIALTFQETEVRLSAKDNTDRLVTALRGRARIEIILNRIKDAQRDLDRGFELARSSEDRQSLQTRLHDIQGQLLLATGAPAAGALTTALEESAGENQTYHANLFLQRAHAELSANRPAEAERDLQETLRIIRAEESRVLASRGAGEAEEIWSPYFLRFQDAYRLLIERQIETGRTAEAFATSERARATEPLDLAVMRGVASPALRSMSIDEIRAQLPSDTYLIEYCVLEKQTYAWILSRDHPVALLPLKAPRSEVDRWNKGLQDAAQHGDVGTFEARLYPPYVLIREPLATIRTMHPGTPPHLVVVPDQAIFGLPICALRDPSTEKYLIEDVASIAIAPSAALYLNSLERDRKLGAMRNPTILLVGDPAFDERSLVFDGMHRLPGASGEIDGIAALYPGADIRRGAEATLADFLQHAKNKNIVHVAAHAIANRDAPYRSLIALAADANGPGAVTAQELVAKVNPDRTRLVVLSACSSAGGAPIGPEGVGPLVRPWIAAGVPAVIGSLWDVNDATTEQLLVSFHQQYRSGGKNAAVALHDAQLRMLKPGTPGVSSAISWGSFQVIGHASSPSESPPHN